MGDDSEGYDEALIEKEGFSDMKGNEHDLLNLVIAGSVFP